MEILEQILRMWERTNSRLRISIFGKGVGVGDCPYLPGGYIETAREAKSREVKFGWVEGSWMELCKGTSNHLHDMCQSRV